MGHPAMYASSALEESNNLAFIAFRSSVTIVSIFEGILHKEMFSLGEGFVVVYVKLYLRLILKSIMMCAAKKPNCF